jgi:hypothetical protein
MALPNQLKSARMTGSTLGKDIPTNIGALEQAICDIFGFTINVNVTESPVGSDNAGIITKALLRQKAAAPVGWRFLDSTGGGEFRLVNNGTYVSIDQNTGTEGTPIWTNQWKMAIATGIVTFSAIPVGPAADPSSDNQLARKAYVDSLVPAAVLLTGDQSVAGIKSFGSFPITPSTAPTTDYQVANKKYVDGQLVPPTYLAILQNRQVQNTGGGTATSGSWLIVPLNTEYEDANNIIDSSALPAFSLAAGTYRIEAIILFNNVGYAQVRLYNVTDVGTQQNIAAKGMLGTSVTAMAGYYGDGASEIYGTFIITGTKQFRIEYQVNTTSVDIGFGRPANFGVEVYSQVKITKIN